MADPPPMPSCSSLPLPEPESELLRRPACIMPGPPALLQRATSMEERREESMDTVEPWGQSRLQGGCAGWVQGARGVLV